MIDHSLQRIHQWLGKNAPRIVEYSLNLGVPLEHLQEFEKRIGKKLPQDFIHLYSIHDGLNEEENLGSFFYGMNFLSIEDVLSDYDSNLLLFDENKTWGLKKTDEQIDSSKLFNPNWITFAFDGAHTGLKLDLAPTAKGKYGQVIFVDTTYEIAILVADSIEQLVEQFANDLENGLYVLEPDALEDGHDYIDPLPSIDIVNWFETEKWKHFLEK